MIFVPTLILFLLMMLVAANRLKVYATQQTHDCLMASSNACSEYVMGAMQKTLDENTRVLQTLVSSLTGKKKTVTVEKEVDDSGD